MERIYVDKRIYNEFLSVFIKNVMVFKVGDFLKFDIYIGFVVR